MAKNFFLQEIDSEKEYEQNISGIIYKVSGTKQEDGGGFNLKIRMGLQASLF